MFSGISGSFGRLFGTGSGQDARAGDDYDQVEQPIAQNSREPAGAMPTASSSPDEQRHGHAQRQRRRGEELAAASQLRLPTAAGGGQEEVEGSLPARLAAASQLRLPTAAGGGQEEVQGAPPAAQTVKIYGKEGSPLAATFTLQHVQDLMGELRGRELFKPLKLGQEGGITVANFYAECANSLAEHDRAIGLNFVLDGPVAHRLIRLELLAARAGLTLQSSDINEPSFKRPESMLSEGAAKLLAHLLHKQRKRTPTDVCKQLGGMKGATVKALENKLRNAYKEEYNGDTHSETRKKSQADVVEQHPAPAVEPPPQGLDNGLFQGAGLGDGEALQQHQQQWQPAAGQYALPNPIGSINDLQGQLDELRLKVQRLNDRVGMLETFDPVFGLQAYTGV